MLRRILRGLFALVVRSRIHAAVAATTHRRFLIQFNTRLFELRLARRRRYIATITGG